MRKGMVFGITVMAIAGLLALPAMAQEDAGAKRLNLPRLAQILHQADANGDHEVTFQELSAKYPQATQGAFDRLDRNDDGVLSKADIPQRGARNRLHRLYEQLRDADTNGDGSVTYEEASAAMPRMTRAIFDRLDRNDDGVISKEDRRRAEDDDDTEE